MKFKKALIISAVGILTATPVLLTSCSTTSNDNSITIGNENLKPNKNIMYDYSNLKFEKEMTINELGDYFYFLTSMINLGSVYDNDSKVYKWNETYKDYSNILYPKLKVEWDLGKDFKLIYDDSIYNKQDESFKMSNDVINIESNVLFRRASVTSFFKNVYDKVIYKKIKETKFFNDIDDNYLYANKCLISIFANLIFKAAGVFPPVTIAKNILIESGAIFDGVGLSIQNLLKNYILTMIKIYPLLIYNTYAIDYNHRTSYWFNLKKEKLFESRYEESKEILDDANKELKDFKKEYFALFDTKPDSNSMNSLININVIQEKIENIEICNSGEEDDFKKGEIFSNIIMTILKPISSMILDQFWIQSIFLITNEISHLINKMITPIFRELIIPLFIFPNYKVLDNLYFKHDVFFLTINNFLQDLKIIFKDTDNINKLYESLGESIQKVSSSLKEFSDTSLMSELEKLYKTGKELIDLIKDPLNTITSSLELLLNFGNEYFKNEVMNFIDKIENTFSQVKDFLWILMNILKIIDEVTNIMPFNSELKFNDISWLNLKILK